MRRQARSRAPQFRLNPLVAACGVLLSAASVHAQEVRKEGLPATETVTVTGIRQSLET